jgi:type I restriction enzyme R subunit
MGHEEEREWQTRKTRIDRRLVAQGWQVVPFRPSVPLSAYKHHAIEEYPTAHGPADYVLVSNGCILGVVEAKKLSLGPQNVLLQAERYSRGVSDSEFNFDGLRVPFLYATNGEVVWFHDIRHDLNRSRQVKDFHTPSCLEELLARDFQNACKSLIDLPNIHHRLRPYQVDANAAVEKAIAERKRQMLVAMATGTGKTFTTVNQVYRLMKSGVAQRILFLVDRRALAAQAVRAFAAFEPEPGLKFDKIYEVYSQRFQREDFDVSEKFDPKLLPKSYLEDPQPGHAFVYVCTIQRMAINLFGRQAVFAGDLETMDEDAEELKIPIHAFDLIIADECHRGYTSAELSVWRNTLDHFDAIKVGLTATPAAHTKAYFNDVVYRYEYERAVREGYLVDYDAVTIKSNVRINGIFLHEGEQIRLVDTTSGAMQLDLLEDERQFDSSDIEAKITAPDSNRKIMEEVRKYALEHEARYGRFPKILIFAQNDLPHRSHADQLVNICRDVFGQGDSFVQKITGTTTDRPLQKIREFRNRTNKPAIVVSVDMLTTGVDIPDLEFIVFLRPVKSRILFEQMLGRGTRKGEKYPDKSHFVVFDCFDGTLLNYFKSASAITAEPPDKPTKTIQQVIEDIWQNRDREYNVRCLVKRLQRINKEMSGDARDQFAPYIADGDVGQFAKELPGRLSGNFSDTMKLVRNAGFIELLINYKRAKKTFVVADTVEDIVGSQWLIRGAAGMEYKPEDYLTAFAQFVRENPEKIQAIQILLNRPKDWGTDSLTELRQKLATTPERFTVDNLQKAHTAQYGKALVEIISMVKHAADTLEPLLTAEERVDRAVTKITAGRSLTEEQRRWMDRIREHMITNLSISQDDFDLMPIFNREGGWGRANRVFDGELDELIHQLNEAIAA